MTVFELTTQLGEYISMEVDDVHAVEYSKDNAQSAAFTVVMESGNRFSVKIEKV